VPEIIPFSFCT